MTVVVTGARGGLGRILVPALQAAGDDVVGLAREDCDMADPGAIARMVQRHRPRLVYHLAGSFAHRYDVDIAVNANAAHHLLEAIRAQRLDTRVVLLGSAAEYGVVEPEENPVAETRVLRPVSIYGVTKAHQTQLGLWHGHAHRADVVVARMFNLLAPGLSERLFVGRVERLVAQWKAKQVDTLELGNLSAQRDYVDGHEAARQLRAVASRGERGGIYHVASGEPVALRTLLQRLLGEAGVPWSAVRENVSGAGGRIGYDVPVIYADVRRTRALGDNSA